MQIQFLGTFLSNISKLYRYLSLQISCLTVGRKFYLRFWGGGNCDIEIVSFTSSSMKGDRIRVWMQGAEVSGTSGDLVWSLATVSSASCPSFSLSLIPSTTNAFSFSISTCPPSPLTVPVTHSSGISYSVKETLWLKMLCIFSEGSR